MQPNRTISLSALLTGVAICMSAGAQQGNGNGKKGGGQGGGESSIRLCADFNSPDGSSNYIDEDGRGVYCDGTDGEILIAEGLKLSTSTRNTADRRVSVYFQGASCGTTRSDGSFDGVTISQDMNTFFANANSSEFVAPAGCSPGDPFDPSFDPDSLECLQSTGTQLPVGEMRQSDGTLFMSMRVNLADPETSAKKGGAALVLNFAENLGPNVCEIGEAALPAAIACTAEEGDSCSEWRFKGFRACAFDYNTTRGGGWQFGGNACPVSTDITFTLQP